MAKLRLIGIQLPGEKYKENSDVSKALGREVSRKVEVLLVFFR
jgi:hypothetical protein